MVGAQGGGVGGRGLLAGRGGGHVGDGGGARGGRQDYDAGYGYNYYDEDSHFNGPPRFNPNLGVHPPNYGPGWDYEQWRMGRAGQQWWLWLE